MSWEMQSALRDLQPFNAGRWAKAQCLWLLQEMSNIDKHRHLHVAVVGYPVITGFQDPDVELIPVWSKDNREGARLRPLTPEAQITSDPHLFPQVILDETLPGDDWRPLDVQLQTFLTIVGDITQELSQRFLSD